MPADSMFVAAGVVLMFVLFAAVLAWGDLQTRPKHLGQQTDARRRPF